LGFTPTGTQLDGDTIPDIETSVGNILNFDLVLKTGNNETVSDLQYILDWDTTELSLYGFTPLGEILGGGNAPIDLTNPDPANVFATYGINQFLATAVGSNVTQTVGTISFKVLQGLNNSTNPDFILTHIFEQSGFGFTEVATRTQQVEVQGAVPTPALLPGIFALGATAIRKRKQQAAAV
jgi:hypothetical protein